MAATAAADAAARSDAAAAESYIGSLISLTSKSEIRYEGVLSTIDTLQSTIALRNVRSFGTEGRKKDGVQIPASDKVYEYILFRGSDIKDLQVKAPPSAQTTPVHNDPAIIQSNYSHPVSASSSSPSAGSSMAAELGPNTTQMGLPRPNFQGGMSLYQPGGTSLPPVGNIMAAELSSNAAQMGLPRPNMQGGLPFYQPVGSIGSWGSSPLPTSTNGLGVARPMYWQGYAPSDGLFHMQQPHLTQPPPGISVPHSLQQPSQYFGMSASLPSSGSSNLADFSSPLLQPVTSTVTSSTTTLSSISAPTQGSSLPSRTPAATIGNENSTFLASNYGTNVPFVPVPNPTSEPVVAVTLSMPSVVSGNPRTVTLPNLAPQTVSQLIPPIGSSSRVSQIESSVPLVTPDQLMQPSLSALASSQQLQENKKDALLKAQEARVELSAAEVSLRAPAGVNEPKLPLHRPTNQKPSGDALHTHYTNRGHGIGGRNEYSHPISNYTEDFDFEAMNEKFNKSEVWGHLGKYKAQLRNKEGELEEDETDGTLEQDDVGSQNLETKPVYVKDDFFDSLSCGSFGRGAQSGRGKYYGHMKSNTETFGSIPRHLASRGGGRGYRGGRGRGSYYGRGYGYAGGGGSRTTSNEPWQWDG